MCFFFFVPSASTTTAHVNYQASQAVYEIGDSISFNTEINSVTNREYKEVKIRNQSNHEIKPKQFYITKSEKCF
jgi:hypothetical protein